MKRNWATTELDLGRRDQLLASLMLSEHLHLPA
jgi:hypothetical protein